MCRVNHIQILWPPPTPRSKKTLGIPAHLKTHGSLGRVGTSSPVAMSVVGLIGMHGHTGAAAIQQGANGGRERKGWAMRAQATKRDCGLLQPPVPAYAGTEGCYVLRVFFFIF